MKTVWLLFNTMDYESDILHSVHAEKPSVETLARFIIDQFGYAYTQEDALVRAKYLYQNDSARFLDNFTWELEERAVM